MNATEPDWLELWRELAAVNERSKRAVPPECYQNRFRKKAHERPDPLLDFILKDIDARHTVLDIAAGSGRWTIALARTAWQVTAVEPAEALANVLRERIADNRLDNVQILPSTWEEATPEPHDIAVCAHGVYLSTDFAAFVRKMAQYARQRCYLGIRLPPADGIIGELSLRIYSHRHDSPNAIIAYNALYSMGIYANVFVEDDIHRWVDTTVEDAFARAKRHLHLDSNDAHDGLIRDTLARRLTRKDNAYVWPDGMRSALLWWRPEAAGG